VLLQVYDPFNMKMFLPKFVIRFNEMANYKMVPNHPKFGTHLDSAMNFL